MRTRDKWGRRKRYTSHDAEVEKTACPFCGGEQLRTYSRANKSSTTYWVQCVCGSKGAKASTRSSAGSLWNKRASIKAPIAHAFHRVLENCKPCCCCGSQPELLSYNVGSQIRCSNPKCFTTIGFDQHRFTYDELVEMWNSLYQIAEGSAKEKRSRGEDV